MTTHLWEKYGIDQTSKHLLLSLKSLKLALKLKKSVQLLHEVTNYFNPRCLCFTYRLIHLLVNLITGYSYALSVYMNGLCIQATWSFSPPSFTVTSLPTPEWLQFVLADPGYWFHPSVSRIFPALLNVAEETNRISKSGPGVSRYKTEVKTYFKESKNDTGWKKYKSSLRCGGNNMR